MRLLGGDIRLVGTRTAVVEVAVVLLLLAGSTLPWCGTCTDGGGGGGG